MTYSTPTGETPEASRGRWAWPWWVILLPLVLIPLLGMRLVERPQTETDPLPQCVVSTPAETRGVRSRKPRSSSSMSPRL